MLKQLVLEGCEDRLKVFSFKIYSAVSCQRKSRQSAKLKLKNSIDKFGNKIELILPLAQKKVNNVRMYNIH